MNVSPNQVDASSAPFTHGNGEVVDRMTTNSELNSNISDLKKTTAIAGQESNIEKLSAELKKIQPSEGPSKSDVVKSPSAGKPEVKKKRARKKWKKPKDKPNRPLSAYNLFFQSERASMLGDVAHLHETDKSKKRIHRKTHGKVGFAEMARIIGQKWKDLPADKKTPFEEKAAVEKKRYATELATWKEEQKVKARAKLREQSLNVNSTGTKGANDQLMMEGNFSPDQLRMQMMADGVNQRNLNLLQQREMEYLRRMKERQAAMAAIYPSASEASANAILQQFQASQFQAMQGMPGMGQGMNPMAAMGGMAGMNAMTGMTGMTGMGGMNANNSQRGGGGNGGGQGSMDDRIQQLREMTQASEAGGSGNGMNVNSLQGMNPMAGMNMNSPMGAMNNMNAMNFNPMNMNGNTGDIVAAMRRMQEANRFNMN